MNLTVLAVSLALVFCFCYKLITKGMFPKAMNNGPAPETLPPLFECEVKIPLVKLTGSILTGFTCERLEEK